MSDRPMKAAIAVALGAGSALACPFAAAAQPPTAPTAIATQQPGHPMQAPPISACGSPATDGSGSNSCRTAATTRLATRQSAYQGRYEITGNHIDYWDDTGFTADGRFVNEDELHHGGMVFHRQPPA